jgi:tetratricopeptide (TPR) repeat protein
MKYTLTKKFDVTAMSRLIEEARKLEVRRDLEGFKQLFSEIWENIDEEPDFSEFSESQQADLLRLTGFFLSYYGKARNLPTYQERSKNLLTKAITLFSQLGKSERVTEATVILAGCYFFEGGINEGDLILEQVKAEFEGDRLNPLYLQICVNRILTMHAKKEYQAAFEILNEISIAMEFCHDYRLCILFHEKCGLTYKGQKEFEKAIYHYQQAVRYSEEINNYFSLALNKNNMANAYREAKEFELAHKYEDEAIALANQHNLIGWLPNFLDTKALIYFDEGYPEQALQTIKEAISIFQKGEDANGLTEAMWNKCKFLLHLNRKEDAILLFNEMIPIAAVQIGEFAVKGFVKEFAKLIHIKHDGTLDEEVRRFKRTEIVRAITEAKDNLHEAAESLKITTTALTKILDKEFPELYDELNLLHQTKFEPNFEMVAPQPSVPRDISQLKLEGSKFVFENKAPLNLKTFYFAAEKMSEAFGIEHDAVVAILPIDKISADEFILVKDLSSNHYSFGKINYDNGLDLYYWFEKGEPIPISLSEFQLIGKAFAFCPFDEIDEDELLFRSFADSTRPA